MFAWGSGTIWAQSDSRNRLLAPCGAIGVEPRCQLAPISCEHDPQACVGSMYSVLEMLESLWEGESKGSLLRGTGPATVDSPRQVTAIRVAALNRDDAKQNRGLPLLHGHRALPQVLWHRDACDSETGAEIGAPRRMQNLRGFRKMRALSRDREKTAAGISRLQQRNPRMPCHSSSSDGCV